MTNVSIINTEQSKMPEKQDKIKRFKKTANQRLARTRRQRGYNWEDTLVKRFNSTSGWRAFRLGSPSVALPDILAVSTMENTIYVIEAKSGTSTTLRVPYDQIWRCLKWTTTFDIFKERKMIIAFKFLSKKRIGKGKYEHRELREYYKTWNESYPVTDFMCSYDGLTYVNLDGRKQSLNLEDCHMPFNKKNT